MDVFGEHEVYFNRGSRELRIHGRRVYVVGANDERAQEKIRGLTLAGAYVDEASTIPESFWMMLRTRLSAEGSRMIATTNPDAPLHWLKRDWLDRADELGVGRFSFRLEDNPHLPDAYVEAVKREFTGLWYRRFILGEWVAAEGAVFDMFDPVLHVSDELPAMQTWWLFVDYGTATVTHALLAGLGTDERLYVAREWRWDAKERRRQLTDAEYSVRLRDWLASGADGAYRVNGKPAPVQLKRAYVDPSAVSFSAQLRRDRWVKPREAENDVLDGIRYTATLLTSGRLCIHRSCAHLIRELTGYRWDEGAGTRGTRRSGRRPRRGRAPLRLLFDPALYAALAGLRHHEGGGMRLSIRSASRSPATRARSHVDAGCCACRWWTRYPSLSSDAAPSGA